MVFNLFARLIFLSSLLSSIVYAQTLHTSSRWILNSSNQRVKLRCVNWAGHGEVNIPEGLQAQPVDKITSWIKSAGFNCVRLTYSIDMALNPNQQVSASFTAAASSTGAGSSLTALYTTAVSKNSWLSSATTLSTYAKVITSLESVGIMVILDNHNSHAGWCCSTSDGNGWWASASGYNDANSRYFDTAKWLQGLTAMATFGKQFSNVVGLSLRNELRAVGSQDGNSHADWYNIVGQGASAIHTANPNALVIVGGVNYATDLGFLYSKPLDRSSLGDKVVWEFHTYSWSNSVTGDCPAYTTLLGNLAGYLLVQGKTYTGPLWLSEFGWAQNGPTALEQKYLACLSSYMTNNDADWAYWALQGSYYYREGVVNYDEGFGVLTKDWSGWRNSSFVNAIGGMWTQTQGP
ncbi:glycosyl hydrolase family 5 protein/cellulase [Bisporella sp. PMI_857]|nr:glycosyl hydrolase family 5 protein/cellulase [Bisporella sp. PMI_857]